MNTKTELSFGEPKDPENEPDVPGTPDPLAPSPDRDDPERPDPYPVTDPTPEPDTEPVRDPNPTFPEPLPGEPPTVYF